MNQPQPDTIACQGHIDKLDPVVNLARFALSTQGTHDKAIEWLKRDNERIEKAFVSEVIKTRNIGKNTEAISWLIADKRRVGNG